MFSSQRYPLSPSPHGGIMYATPPWKPTAIELTTTNRVYWWQVGDVDDRPERWRVDLDVRDNGAAPCPQPVRRVGVIELAVAELAEDPQLFRPAAAGSWAREFLAEALTQPGSGVLVDELAQLLAPGPARVVLLRHVYLHDTWRGCGLAAPLVSAALHRFAPMARLAACRVGAADIAELMPGLTRAENEEVALHAARLLERAGFFTWNGVHLVGLHDPAHQAHQLQLSEDVTTTELEDALDDVITTDTETGSDGDESPDPP